MTRVVPGRALTAGSDLSVVWAYLWASRMLGVVGGCWGFFGGGWGLVSLERGLGLVEGLEEKCEGQILKFFCKTCNN